MREYYAEVSAAISLRPKKLLTNFGICFFRHKSGTFAEHLRRESGIDYIHKVEASRRRQLIGTRRCTRPANAITCLGRPLSPTGS